MSKPVRDALIREILDRCAGKTALCGENEVLGVGRYRAEDLSRGALFSPCRLGPLALGNRCAILPLGRVGGADSPDEAARRFYLARSGAALLSTGPIPASKKDDPFPALRWLPLNERMHARGARMLLQIALDGSTPAQTANLAVAAPAGGFDGVCLNARENDTGLLETVREIRARRGASLPILCRVSLSPALAESGLLPEGGRAVPCLAERLETMTALARAGVDGFELSLGGPEAPWLLAPGSRFPAGCYAEAARALKAHFRCLGIGAAVLAYGRLGYPALDEKLLRQSLCDMVSLDGAGIDDPDWVEKARRGCGEDICPLPSGALNVKPGAARVAVVGAGERGLRYAIAAADRGMQVDLYEEKDRLGGTLARYASQTAYEKQNQLDYLLRELGKRPSIRVRRGTRADAELLKREGYDRIALGCRAAAVRAPSVPGWGEIPFADAERISEPLSGAWKKKKVTVIGSGTLACDLAWALLEKKLARRVSLITERPMPMPDESAADREHFRHFFPQRGGEIVSGCTLLRMRRHSLVYRDARSGKEVHLPCDRIVLLEEAPASLRLYREAVAERIAPEIVLL